MIPSREAEGAKAHTHAPSACESCPCCFARRRSFEGGVRSLRDCGTVAKIDCRPERAATSPAGGHCWLTSHRLTSNNKTSHLPFPWIHGTKLIGLVAVACPRPRCSSIMRKALPPEAAWVTISSGSRLAGACYPLKKSRRDRRRSARSHPNLHRAF